MSALNIFPPPPPPIVLPPSDDETALVDAINLAAKSGRDLLLEPGVHYTKPGFDQRIPIGPRGLRMASFASSKSSAKATIRRPDHSVPPVKGSLSYGLFFIPSPPTPAEEANAVWKQTKDANDNTFEYAVVMRGAIGFGDLVVDCNMGNQDLETAVHDAAEHSAMIGFSGFSYAVDPDPNSSPPIRRLIYVGFEKIVLQDVEFLNGGYADDVWFPSRGGIFHPNIDQVVIQRVVSGRRLNPLRSTIDFSVPAPTSASRTPTSTSCTPNRTPTGSRPRARMTSSPRPAGPSAISRPKSCFSLFRERSSSSTPPA